MENRDGDMVSHTAPVPSSQSEQIQKLPWFPLGLLGLCVFIIWHHHWGMMLRGFVVKPRWIRWTSFSAFWGFNTRQAKKICLRSVSGATESRSANLNRLCWMLQSSYPKFPWKKTAHRTDSQPHPSSDMDVWEFPHFSPEMIKRGVDTLQFPNLEAPKSS